MKRIGPKQVFVIGVVVVIVLWFCGALWTDLLEGRAVKRMMFAGYDAEFINRFLLDEIHTGETVEVDLTVRNCGTKTWVGHGALKQI